MVSKTLSVTITVFTLIALAPFASKVDMTAAKRTKHIIAETCENVLLLLKDSVIMVSSD